MQFDTEAGLYFLVDNSTHGLSSSGARILIGTLSGAENDTDTLHAVFTDTAARFRTAISISSPAWPSMCRTIRSICSTSTLPGESTPAADSVFERISFSGANFSGTATVTQLATLPGPLSSGMALDTSNPPAETAYFIKSNNSVTSQGNNETVSENAIVKATWNVATPNTVTITSLPLGGLPRSR